MPTVTFNWGKAATIIVILGTLLGGVYFIEDRYATAADVKQEVGTIIQAQRAFERRQLEDKVFEIEIKEEEGSATSSSKALKQRYLRKIQELQ
ncbi:hypothetical protein KAR91_22040 [Candidatus Pacearchaeota archaeon]|nr:hypothetical protein [Candidatus Pacearchaeota archaeon]